MKIILFIVIIITSFSCTINDLKNKSSDKESVSGCDLFNDTLIYAGEQMSPSNSPIEFINIREIFSRVKNDYHQLDIEMQSIPDSICYNNPNITKGFTEYGMDIILRNKLDSTNIDNLVVTVYYNNFDSKESGPICSTFQEFINNCNSSISIIKQSLEDTIREDPTYDYIHTDFSINIEENTISIKIPKKDLCKYYENYLSEGFTAKLTYNDSKKQGENNYHTTKIVTDRWIRHNFIYNSSRRLE